MDCLLCQLELSDSSHRAIAAFSKRWFSFFFLNHRNNAHCSQSTYKLDNNRTSKIKDNAVCCALRPVMAYNHSNTVVLKTLILTKNAPYIFGKICFMQVASRVPSNCSHSKHGSS